MPDVAVIVPWRPGCPYREDAWKWVQARYRTEHPDWQLVEAHPPRGPWIKAAAVNPAVDAITADIVIVADADVWCDDLDSAVEAVTAGAPWAVPHRHVHRLTPAATLGVLAGGTPDPTDVVERPYLGVHGGGIVVLPRATALDVPLDPRYEGWGQEDVSWAMALWFLTGPAWRGTAPLLHLWHPPAERMTRRHGSVDSFELWRRYRNARRDPALMRALIEEVTLCRSPSS